MTIAPIQIMVYPNPAKKRKLSLSKCLRIAVNPKNAELAARLKDAGLPVVDIHELKEIAERTTGKPQPIAKGDRAVANVIYRDGTIIDTIYNVPNAGGIL